MTRTCPHLAPLELELEAHGICLGEGMTSPYGPQWGIWFYCDCIFDADSLRTRLKLSDFITYQEYDGRVAGNDATFYCPQCQRAIMGPHPSYATAKTAKLG